MIPQKHSTAYDPADLRYQSFTDRVPPPRDPVQLAIQDGRQPKNAATGFVLFPQSAMPCGKFAGLLMERVPARYLLDVQRQFDVDASQLPGNRQSWRQVADYVSRHLDQIQAQANR